MSGSGDKETGPSEKEGKPLKNSDDQEEEEEEEEYGFAIDHHQYCGGEDAFVPVKKRKYLRRLTQDQDQDQTPIDVTRGGNNQNPIVIDNDDSEPETSVNKKGIISIADSRQEIFLFQKQLEPGDIRHGRLDIPWETAEKYFPPRTEPYEAESILISDHRNMNWPVKVLNNPQACRYKFMFGWNEFVEAHNLEAMDVVTFYRPIQPSQNYHYFITYAKAQEKALLSFIMKE
ncbi:hypothetical protein U1Q18_020494 [Sarracenia purpurea var. burkii]